MSLSRPKGRESLPNRGVLDAGLPAVRPAGAEWLDRLFKPLEGFFNRVYRSEWNPLYKSGPLALAMLGVTLLTTVLEADRRQDRL